MLNMMKQVTINAQVAELKEKFKPSGLIDLKFCRKCSFCCWRRPGLLDKNDVVSISKFLGITKQRLFNDYLVIEYVGFGNSYCLLPRRKEQSDIAGELISSDRTFDIGTPCIFLENKLCKINKVKPIHCRHCGCWKDSKIDYIGWSKKDLIELGWDGLDEE